MVGSGPSRGDSCELCTAVWGVHNFPECRTEWGQGDTALSLSLCLGTVRYPGAGFGVLLAGSSLVFFVRQAASVLRSIPLRFPDPGAEWTSEYTEFASAPSFTDPCSWCWVCSPPLGTQRTAHSPRHLLTISDSKALVPLKPLQQRRPPTRSQRGCTLILCNPVQRPPWRAK
jgi:hypothetical protein